MRATIEVTDIFRSAGPAYRAAHAGHLSLSQLKVMSAVETCRTAALGGHVEACSDCGHQRIAYNSCRNRHCPRCQGAAARTWLEAQQVNLLPVGYFHVVFTFRYKDYRRSGANRQRVMTLAADEFIRRFLIQVLPRGFHCIRHYGLLAGAARKESLAQARDILGVAPAMDEPPAPETAPDPRLPCPCCGGTMVITETFAPWCQPRGPPTARPSTRETVHDPA